MKPAKKQVLILDDEPEVRDLLSKMLTPEYSCVAVGSEAELLTACDEGGFDLYLLDIILPEPNPHGVELAWKLRKKGIKAPFVAVSAALEQWDKEDLKDCGFDDFLPKPFDLDTVLTKVRYPCAP